VNRNKLNVHQEDSLVYVNGYLRLLSHFFEDVKNTKTYKNWDSISDEANSEDGALVWEDLEVDLIAEDDDYVERSVPSTAIVSNLAPLQNFSFITSRTTWVPCSLWQCPSSNMLRCQSIYLAHKTITAIVSYIPTSVSLPPQPHGCHAACGSALPPTRETRGEVTHGKRR
jgi:hypothetical protein